MKTKRTPEENQRLFAKAYLVLIVAMYIGLGLYFALFDLFGTFQLGRLPGWSYRLFGLVLIIYGVVRFYRAIIKDHKG